MKLIPLIFLTLTAAACPQKRESQRSRDYLECVYQAEYGYSGFNAEQKSAAKARCLK